MSIFVEMFSSFLLFINQIVGDWGITIIAITFTVKFVMLPFTLKQKKSMEQQQQMSKETEALKAKYKHDKKKLDEELAKLSAKYVSSLSGMLIPFLQLPVLLGLYKAISAIPLEVITTAILPWINNIKLPDGYYLIPVISVILQLLPNSLYYIKAFRSLGLTKPKMGMIIPILLINLLFVANAPAIIGIYWIASSFYAFVEQLAFNLYKLRKQRTFGIE